MAVLSGSCPDSGSRVRNLTGKRRARCDYPAGALNQPSGADGSRGKKTKPVPQGSLSAPRRQRRNRVHSEAASGRIRTETSREYLRFIEEELSSASLQTGSSFNSRSSRKRLPHEGDSRRRGKSAEELCDPRDSQTGKSGQPFREIFSGDGIFFSEEFMSGAIPVSKDPFLSLDDYLAGNGSSGHDSASRVIQKGADGEAVSAQLPEFSGKGAAEYSGRLELRPREEYFQNLAALIGEAREHLPLRPDEFSEKVLPLIENALNYMDALPASECYHHCEAGGLFRHSMETAALTLSFLKRDVMTVGDEPEQRRRKAVLYALSVYTGGLLHDAGKAVSDMEVMTADGDVWSPVQESLRGFLQRCGARSYFFRYRPKRGRTHENLTPLLAREIIPPPLLRVLMSEPALYSELFDALYGNPGSAFYSIIKKADTGSVEADLRGTGAALQRFARKPHALIRLIAALQNRIRESPVPFNAPGSYLWYIDEILYLVLTPDRFWELIRFGADMGINLNLRDFRDLAEKLVLLGIAQSFSESSGEVLTPLVINDRGRARLLLGLEIIAPEYFCQNLVLPCSLPGTDPAIRDLLLRLKREGSSREYSMEELSALLPGAAEEAPSSPESDCSSHEGTAGSSSQDAECGCEDAGGSETPGAGNDRRVPHSEGAGSDAGYPETEPLSPQDPCHYGLSEDTPPRKTGTGGTPLRDFLAYLDSGNETPEASGGTLYAAVNALYSKRKRVRGSGRTGAAGKTAQNGEACGDPGRESAPESSQESCPPETGNVFRNEASSAFLDRAGKDARGGRAGQKPAQHSPAGKENPPREAVSVSASSSSLPEKPASAGNDGVSGTKSQGSSVKKTAELQKKGAVSGKASRKKKLQTPSPEEHLDVPLFPVPETEVPDREIILRTGLEAYSEKGGKSGNSPGDDDWALNPLREKRTPPRPRNASGRFIKLSEARAETEKAGENAAGKGPRYFV